MKYLLDTDIILWWLIDPENISPKAREIISDRKQKIYLSSASFLEIAIKKSIGKLTLPGNIIEMLLNEGFELLPITPEEGLSVSDLPPLHADPFDRMLVIQAKLNDMVLITRDDKMGGYPVVILEG